MKQLFYIGNESSNSGQELLSLRVGERHCSFAITDSSASELHELAYCAISQPDENELANVFAAYPQLHHSFSKVQVAYDFPQSILLASNEYKEENAAALLNIAGDTCSILNTTSDMIAEWQLYNIYSVRPDIRQWMMKKMPTATFHHQYSLAIKNSNTGNINGSLVVDFRKDDFTVLVTRESKFLLAQTFEYSTPDDVLYYLLKITRQFCLSQQEVKLQLSGLIDQQSALYKELYQYFVTIGFREAGWNLQNDYPAHFFTSLNDLATCAS